MSGKYTTLPGLKVLDKEQSEWDRKIFQIDDQYDRYLQNKKSCREEGIQKYYKESNLLEKTIHLVNQFMLDHLTQEYPEIFELNNQQLINKRTSEKIDLNSVSSSGSYLSVFDALCSQVQEDLAVFQLTDTGEYLSAIHLCSPNFWSPGDKIGKPFDQIHLPVADMEQTLKHYPAMLKSVVEKTGPFTRFAWGVGTDNRLNHHPEPPVGMATEDWQGRKLSTENDPLFLRVERQNLIGFPEVNAFLFTIRTYFYEVEHLDSEEKKQLGKAIQSMSSAALAYKGLDDLLPILRTKLKIGF